ncbi:alpha-1,2-mannosidase, putative [Porphyromonadaceae bacterium KHP3R9]|nr:alpha-1,2-mannosidase, putative [Porphyromonadaceae bacterium KHP3R9]
MKHPSLGIVICCLLISSCIHKNTSHTELGPLTSHVDPYIGTAGFGNVFLAANVPFGHMQVGPTQHSRPPRGGEWCSGYNYSDSIVIGFGHLHLSGTGIGDLGDISLMPVLDEREREVLFSHDDELVKPGYYSVVLGKSGIRAEMTATMRTGFHRYTFPTGVDTGKVVLNLRQGIGFDRMTDCCLLQENDTVVSGYRFSTGWAQDQKVFYSALFSLPILNKKMVNDTICILSFDLQDHQSLQIKVGLSAVSVENAKLNMERENRGWDFNGVVAEADQLWEKELSKIRITTNDEKASTIFYSSLFHTMVAPAVFCDVNGDYRGADGQIYRNADFVNYSVLSLWDTYRAVHPLATLIHPERQKDFAVTMLKIFEQTGRLPLWHLMGNETFCMSGNPSFPVITDIALKGFDVDKEAIYNAIKASALLQERGQPLLDEYGFIPYDKESIHSVAQCLDFAVTDASGAQLANLLGKEEDYTFFLKRSLSYQKHFDPATGFMRAITTEGKFREPFDPCLAPQGAGSDYTEGNAWQWTWHVQHDAHGLIELFGGEQQFVKKLDSIFIIEGGFGVPNTINEGGVIGQYYHGNEPSHHIIYLYNYAGEPWKAAHHLREVMAKLYAATPRGICGNEDAGQLSAWYVLSSIGLYQVEPSGGKFIIGTPLFDKVTMNVGGGKEFRLIAHNNSSENIYIQSARLNGKPYTKSYIHFKDINQGGTLELEMGNIPSRTFGTAKEDRP